MAHQTYRGAMFESSRRFGYDTDVGCGMSWDTLPLVGQTTVADEGKKEKATKEKAGYWKITQQPRAARRSLLHPRSSERLKRGL